MPQCWKCNCFVPPDMSEKNKETNQYLCHYCRDDKTVLYGSDGTIYDKNAVLEEYKKFIKKLAENENLRKEMTNKMVRDAIADAKR